MNVDEIKKSYVNGLHRTGALLIHEKPVKINDGYESHIYLNHREFLIHSAYLRLVANIYSFFIKEHSSLTTEYSDNYQLGVIDSIMSPVIVGAMSIINNKKVVIIKTDKIQSEEEKSVYGNLNTETVIIDDVIASGATIIQAAQKIREAGGKVNYAIVCAARDRSVEDKLAKEGIKLLSLVSFNEIFELIEDKLSENQRSVFIDEINQN